MIEQLIIHQIGLSSEIYLRLIELCKMVYVRKNDFLLRQGKVCSFIGIVKSGVLRSYISKEEEEHNSDFYFEDFLPEFSHTGKECRKHTSLRRFIYILPG